MIDSGDRQLKKPDPDCTGPEQPHARMGRSRRKFRRLAVSLSAILAVLVTGFAVFAFHVASLRPAADPPVSDAIVVLTGGYNRLETALGLLKEGKGKRLLISGVHPRTRLADLRLVTGADATLFSCCIDVDRTALDTIGNAAESAKWLYGKGYRKVLLVTNNYHMPRSLLETRRVFRGIMVYPHPVVTSDIGVSGWLTRPDALRVLVTEYVKYLAALARAALPLSDDGENTDSSDTKNAKAGG